MADQEKTQNDSVSRPSRIEDDADERPFICPACGHANEFRPERSYQACVQCDLLRDVWRCDKCQQFSRNDQPTCYFCHKSIRPEGMIEKRIRLTGEQIASLVDTLKTFAIMSGAAGAAMQNPAVMDQAVVAGNFADIFENAAYVEVGK